VLLINNQSNSLNKNILSKVFYNLGYAHKEKADYLLSLEYFTESLKVDLDSSNRIGSALTYNMIGLVYCSMGDFNKSMENHLLSLSLRFKEFGVSHSHVSESYNNIGRFSFKICFLVI
jgi:tetratricopeptide (TPR) repeat protein